MLRSTIAIPCLAVLLAGAPCVLVAAAEPMATTVTSAALNEKDAEFVTEALRGGEFEIKSSKLALERGLSDADKAFAKKIIEDHGKMNDELTSIAKDKGAVIPGALDEKGQKNLDKLGKTEDAKFAETYLEEQIDCHKKAVSAFEDASKNAKDADVKAFATKHLPHLQAHLDEAKRLEKQK